MKKLTLLLLLLVVPFFSYAQFKTKPHNLERKGKYTVGVSFSYYFDSLDRTAPNWYREFNTNIRVGKYVSNRWIVGVSSWLIYSFPDNTKRELYTITGGYADYNFLFLQAIPMYAEFGLHYSNYCYREEGVFRDNNVFGQIGLGINPKIGKEKRWGLDFGFHSYQGIGCRDCTYGLLIYRVGIDWILPSFKNTTKE